ncbi:hypothetical protein CTAYLR_001947 [Chrysophaeum taylorii]|uniref:Calponin-homology (CH) domain-containing protein n=1 Tax=Chrysophaeum taylorii TaxID=2483200 RepID=A0AAD7U8F7_9STRA|nr:hypothetical protein CTAYLR_001947 [Chrysophaeum taylorii]
MSISQSEVNELKRLSVRGDSSEPKWLRRQRKLFTNFCNAKLADRDDVPPMTDILEDIKDGQVLYALLEELSGQSLAPLGRIKKPRPGKVLSHIDKVANLSISFRYIHQTTKIVGIGPGDIADGHSSLVLGLLWSLITFFTAKDLGGIDDVSALKKKILKWCQKRTEKNTDVDVRNLKDSFMGGRAFHAILNDVDPVNFPYEPSTSATENFARAFAEAAEKYGVPELLDANDEDLWKDEQAMVTYLSELMKRLPEHAALDASIASLKWADDHKDEIEADFEKICGVPSFPTKVSECAKCAEMLKDIAAPALDAEVVSFPDDDAPPFVVAKSYKGARDPKLPSILFVADYGVDPSIDDDSFIVPVKAGDRLKAAAAGNKAGCVAAIQAVAAILETQQQGPDNKPQANVDIVLTCASAQDVAQEGRVEKFLHSQFGGGDSFPDYVVVDAPGAAVAVAPDSFNTVFACRGYVEMSVRATVAETSAKLPYADPLIDANLGLCQVLAALRKPTTMLPNVPGLVGFAEPNRFTRAVSGVQPLDPEQLAESVGYPVPPRRLAKLPRDQWTCVEQLCFHPGLAVTKMVHDDDDGCFPATSAEAHLAVYLAPGFDPSQAKVAVTDQLNKSALPWGLSLSIAADDDQPSQGFITNLVELFLTKFTAAAGAHFAHRTSACAASPEYLPLVAACSRGMQRTPVYGCGIADTKANIATKDESLLLDDLTSSVKTFIKLLTTMKTVHKHSHNTGPFDPEPLFVAGATEEPEDDAAL